MVLNENTETNPTKSISLLQQDEISMILLLTLLITLHVTDHVTNALPSGHGKPLGEHNDLKTPAVEEDYTKITSQYFYEKYIRTRTPVIMRGLAKSFPAFDLWSDEYITVCCEAFVI